jgi:hypothetical protein
MESEGVMDRDFCKICDLTAPHSKDDCFAELVRKKKIADAMFQKAVSLLVKLGDPVDPKNKDLDSEIVALDLETWRWAS